MSKKVSAYQVYTEDQSRHSRSYSRSSTAAVHPQSQGGDYLSPPPARSHRTASMDSYRQGRGSSSPEVRRDRSYRDDPRYADDIRQNDGRDLQTRYSDDRYNRDSWERDNRHDDYGSNSNNYMDQRRPAAAKGQSSALYTDSDEELLHESLQRKKLRNTEGDDRRWSSDDYDDYRAVRKTDVGGSGYRTPSPEWRDTTTRPFTPPQDHSRVYSEESELSDSPPVKKKKMKKSAKAKDKKYKMAAENSLPVSSNKIQSLMDVKIPSNVKKQVEQNTDTSATKLRSLGDSRPVFKFGQQTERPSQSLLRNQDDNRRNSDRYGDSRKRSRYDDDHYQDRRSRRESGRRESESDRRGYHSHRDSYRRRDSPDYNHRAYRSTDDFDRGRDRQRRNSYSRDSRSRAEVSGAKRRRTSSAERRDWTRSGGGHRGQRDRSPGRNYSDSDQDSERGGRRSWRDERRDRQPKRKEEDRDKGSNSKAEKSKSKQTVGKSSSTAKKDTRHEQVPPGRIQVLPCKDGVAVLLSHPHKISVRGRARLRVLAGEVSVMGYTMEAKEDKAYDLYAPSTSSLITINTTMAEKEKKPLRKAVQAVDLEDKAFKEFQSGAVILWATGLDFPAGDYICTHPPFTQLFRFNFERPGPGSAQTPTGICEAAKVGAAFLPTDQSNTTYLKESEEFNAALKKWTNAVKDSKVGPVALLCGGVNSGKSTFSRYMVNAALMSVPKVCYLDCDVGQTEFSPPGTVALTVLDSPIFGPPFCHQKTAERLCFYGMVNPAEGPTHYVKCVDYVLKAYREMETPPPLVVNTIGWNKDMGLQLFVDILDLLTPDLVVQFNVSSEVLNFPPITPHFAAHEPGWMYNTEPIEEEDDGEEEEEEEKEEKEKKSQKEKKKKRHDRAVIQSLVSSRNDPTRINLTPKNMRDLSLLAHLMSGFPSSVTLMSAAPYVVPWRHFAVHACHCQLAPSAMLHSLEASVVALCKANLSEAFRESEDMPLVFHHNPVCECLGYAMVCHVDHEKQTIDLVTSLSLDRLRQVNTLMRGTVAIPDQLPLKQGHMEEAPFIDALESATALAPVRPRTRMPRRH